MCRMTCRSPAAVSRRHFAEASDGYAFPPRPMSAFELGPRAVRQELALLRVGPHPPVRRGQQMRGSSSRADWPPAPAAQADPVVKSHCPGPSQVGGLKPSPRLVEKQKIPCPPRRTAGRTSFPARRSRRPALCRAASRKNICLPRWRRTWCVARAHGWKCERQQQTWSPGSGRAVVRARNWRRFMLIASRERRRTG